MLEEIELPWSPVPQNSAKGLFIQEALKHIRTHQAVNERIPGFEASNYFCAAGILEAIRDHSLTAGNRFCEWGSGFGVVTCLALMSGFDARGIEIEESLVNSALQLARNFGLKVEISQGTYRMELDDMKGPEVAQHAPSPIDCDIVYIYPWPAEVSFITEQFDRAAQPGTLLVSFLGGGRFRLQRKRAD